ncbi:MAG: macro domain-containing protein [Chloroflexi bacterium]|nr:macro domain-containing protein [Chloroflexota bacterium]
MIQFKTGNILDERADALVNTVNCVGFMGRGLSLQFKKAFPENYRAYAAACRQEEVRPGRMFVVENTMIDGPRYIVNFPTKRHWRAKSRMEDIEAGLEALAREVRQRDIRSIAIPPLGSGLGGLVWSDVRSRIVESMRPLDDVQVVVFEPSADFKWDRMRDNRPVPRMTKGRAALVGLIQQYLNGGLDPFVTLLEIHKLMYFMQCAGEPLRLRFRAAQYGPYAENLRHVLHAVEGYYVSGYADGGDDPRTRLQLTPCAYEEAISVLEEHRATQERFERVTRLVDGFESSFGLELLATVHWVLGSDQNVQNEKELVARLHAWEPPKKQFTARQVGIAAQRLATERWARALAG